MAEKKCKMWRGNTYDFDRLISKKSFEELLSERIFSIYSEEIQSFELYKKAKDKKEKEKLNYIIHRYSVWDNEDEKDKEGICYHQEISYPKEYDEKYDISNDELFDFGKVKTI